MSEEIIEKSIKCLANAKLNETTYEVARDITLEYLTNLQQKVEQLEKDNKRLKEWKEDLLSENIELENIRKEAIKKIDKNSFEKEEFGCWFRVFKTDLQGIAQDLLNILNKGSE